jgi:hypothetical protein
MKALYFRKEAYFVDMFGKIKSNQTTLYNDRNNCSSLLHIERWLSMNDVLNIAHFLNEGWCPNWDDITELKYTIVLNKGSAIVQKVNFPSSFVYFPSINIASQAIAIAGNERLLQILQG